MFGKSCGEHGRNKSIHKPCLYSAFLTLAEGQWDLYFELQRKSHSFWRSCIMHQLPLAVCLLLSLLTVDSSKKGRNFTVHSSQLSCSLPGPQGPPGSPGSAGPSGGMGKMGTPGVDGQDGEDGDGGEKGEKGDQGRLGYPGKHGPLGRPGLVGKAGVRGPKGVRGPSGVSGAAGVKGEPGDVGEIGPPGGCDCGAEARSAFSVAVTKSYPKERTPIRFNRILMNEGGHYNATSGKFNCVIPGVYYFTYDITLANKHLAIGLVHNGQYKIRTFDANTGNYDVASGSTILRLQKGDQVWLQIFYSEQNGLFFDPFWTDSVFTGFLIFADQAEPPNKEKMMNNSGSS